MSTPSHYFGNAIQSIPTVAQVGEILSRDLRWCAELLHQNVVAHGDATVRRGVEDWEKVPRLFPLVNFDGASITMGSSPRLPIYDNDFGWGRPLAVRSGKANKFDGKISAFAGRQGDGSVDLEVVLAPETMAGLENDMEFMQYASPIVKVVADLKAAGTTWIQFDEPTLVRDLNAHQLQAFTHAYAELESPLSGLNVMIQTCCADVTAVAYKTLISLKAVTANGFDLAHGKRTLDQIKGGFPSGKFLFAGVVDGREVWPNNLASSLSTLQALEGFVGKGTSSWYII